LALEKRIIARAIELTKQNPDVDIQLSCFVNIHKVKELEIDNYIRIEYALKIIEIIEKYLAEQHPHKQTEIEFPKTQHEKLMDIAKGIQALNIPKSKK
jgi:hypothetical protein